MPDLLVRLYALPPAPANPADVVIRRALAHEKSRVTAFAQENFGSGWASECEVSLCRTPTSCFIAVMQGEIRGFACYDAIALGFFGPMGISLGWRGRGIGAALLHAALAAMRLHGYAYAIVGAAAAGGFYSRVAGAAEIAGSTPGLYADPLRRKGEA